MAAVTSKRHSSGPVMRSLSPSGRLYSAASSAASSGFASSSSAFAARTSAAAATSFFHRSASPTRVNMYGTPASNSSVRFSLDRSTSPSRPISVTQRNRQVVRGSGGGPKTPRRTCMCSPTTHPGSFRCSLHKNFPSSHGGAGGVTYSPNRLNARRSAMTNSLVRIGGVEGADLVKRALAALIRPSSHQQRRRSALQPLPSRLSVMSRAEDS